jgi:hypothetical protein
MLPRPRQTDVLRERPPLYPPSAERVTTDIGPKPTGSSSHTPLRPRIRLCPYILFNAGYAVGYLGILYLVFVWTFIPAIVALVEGIIYLTKTDEEFSAKYA